MTRLHTLLTLLTCAVLITLGPPPAHADEPPGVYDVATDRTLYPASGSMTVTFRFTAPAGSQVAVHATCAISLGGELTWSGQCDSGSPFAYSIPGSVGYVTDAEVEVTTTARTPDTVHYFGTTTTSFDGVPPSVNVLEFRSFDGTSPVTTMAPGAVYRAGIQTNDNVHVQGGSCTVERIDPAEVLSTPSCPVFYGIQQPNYFTAPSTSGDYLFVAVAMDVAGNQATSSRTFTVDATPPVVSPASGPTGGASTNEVHPTWSWTSDEAATFTCAVHAQGVTGSPTACTSPYTTTTGLVDGTDYVLDIAATDQLGNTGTTSFSFAADQTKPTMAVSSGPNDGATVPTTEVSYGFFATEPVSYLCWWGTPSDPISYSPCTSGQIFTLPGDGAYAFAFRAQDAAGNLSDPVLRTVTVAVPPPVVTPPDTTAPSLTVTKEPVKKIRLRAGKKTTKVKVTLTLSEPGTVYFRLDGGAWAKGGTALRARVGKGKHKLEVYAVDTAGNKSPTATLKWKVLPAKA